MIPAVAGARQVSVNTYRATCVAKESNQRKATAGYHKGTDRGAGQKPKRTICRPGFATPLRGARGSVRAKPKPHPGPSLTFARRLQISAPGKLVYCKCRVSQTCVRQALYSSQNSRQNKHTCARILIRRVKVGDEAGRSLWPGLAPTEPRAPRSGVANGYPADGSFRFLTCPAIGALVVPRGRLSLVTFFGHASCTICVY